MPLTVTHAKSQTFADWSGAVTVANSSGGTTTVQGTDLLRPSDWNSSHLATIQLHGSEAPPVSFFEHALLPNTNSTLSAPGIGTWYLQAFHLPFRLSSGQINVFVSNAAGFLNGNNFTANSTGSASHVQTLYHNLALYMRGSGASSTRLETVWTGRISFLATRSLVVSTSVSTSRLRMSNYLTLSFPSQFDASGGVTYGSTSQSGSTTANTTSTANSTIVNGLITGALAYLSGARMDIIPLDQNLAAGDYWLAHNFWSTSQSAGTRYTALTQISTQSRIGMIENNIGAYKRLGVSVSNSTSGPTPFEGFLATTSSGASGNIATSDMRATTGQMYWHYYRTTY
jgi:hypothetical protein